MRCPACGSAVPDEEITAELAHCPTCEHIWEMAFQGSSPRSRTALPTPPPGVEARVDGESLRITLPWNHGLGWSPHLLWLLILPGLLTGRGSSSGLWSLLLASVVVPVTWAAMRRNQTELRIDPRGVEVRHGPVPDPLRFSGDLGPEALHGLRIHASNAPFGPANASPLDGFHSLATVDHVLLRNWNNREKLEYVEDCILTLVEDLPEATTPPVPSPPDGVIVRTRDGTVELEMPWSTTPGGLVHALWLVILPAAAVPGGMGVSLLLFLVWVYLLVNRTTVRISPTAVRLTHGPLPFLLEPDRHRRAGQLAHLHVQSTGLPWSDERRHHARVSDTAGPLTSWWLDPAKLEYVQACIQAVVQPSSSALPDTTSAERSRPEANHQREEGL